MHSGRFCILREFLAAAGKIGSCHGGRSGREYSFHRAFGRSENCRLQDWREENL